MCGPKISLCCFGYTLLLGDVYIFLRGCLNIVTAGLDFYKMYSDRIDTDYVYLKVAIAPVPLQYPVTLVLKNATSNIFALLPY